MKIKDIITEGQVGRIGRRFASGSTGIIQSRDNGFMGDRVYHLNRIMMASGMHDGLTEDPLDDSLIDITSWVETYNTAHPYTLEEYNKIKGALATIQAEEVDIVPFKRPSEIEEVNKVSPVIARGPVKLKKKNNDIT